MKKIYLHPEMLVVRIETTGMLALSTFDDDPQGAGKALAPHRNVSFDEDEEEDEEY